MQVAIGLPATIPGVPGQLIVDWAKKAEDGPFSSLGMLDRVVYPNYEPLITLAAAAGATRRIGLITNILIAPLRSAANLAKQASSLDALSNGRLTLGLAVGGREDDFLAAEVPFHERGKIFDKQLETMTRIWAGEALNDRVGPIGPAPVRPGGPEILIGGFSPAAIQRVGKWGNGFIVGGGGPQMAEQGYKVAETAWKEAGRPGKPRFVAGLYCAIGPKDKAGSYLLDYYRFMGPRAEQLVSSLPTTPQELKGVMQAYEAIGLDELILWPCIPELDQVDRLAEVVS